MVSDTLCPAVQILGSQNFYSRAEGITDYYWPWIRDTVNRVAVGRDAVDQVKINRVAVGRNAVNQVAVDSVAVDRVADNRVDWVVVN